MVAETPSALLPCDAPIADLLESAIGACARRHRLPVDVVVRQLEAGDRALHSSFRYCIAKELSAYFASLGTVFHAVYVYGSSIGQESNPASDIDIIVVVAAKRDEVIRFLRRLDLALAVHFRRLIGSNRYPASLLDVLVLDDSERGHPELPSGPMHGLHTRPICLLQERPESPKAVACKSERTFGGAKNSAAAASER